MAVPVVVVFAIALSGCVTYRIQGGPDKVDLSVRKERFTTEVPPLVEKSDRAVKQLEFVADKEAVARRFSTVSSVLVCVGSGFLAAGAIFAAEENWGSSVAMNATAVSFDIAALVVSIIGSGRAPTDLEYMGVLRDYNQDFPDSPFEYRVE